MILARAGAEAIDELINICNAEVPGGKLSKHRFKHAFKIDIADFYVSLVFTFNKNTILCRTPCELSMYQWSAIIFTSIVRSRQ